MSAAQYPTKDDELGILSGLLGRDHRPILKRYGITEASLVSDEYRKIFGILCRFHESGLPIDTPSVLSELGTDSAGIQAQATVTKCSFTTGTSSHEMIFEGYCVAIYRYRADLHNKQLLQRMEEGRKRGDDLGELASQFRPLTPPEEKERPKSSLTIRTVGEIFDMEFDDADNFFGDRIIAAGQPVTLLGPGGVGKSRLVLQLAICMITGRPFLGMPTHARGKKWLILQTENSNRRLKRDVVNMLSAMGFHNSREDMKAIGNCLFIHTIEQEVDTFLDLEDPESFRQIELLIDSIKPDFVVFDPLNTFTSLELNSDRDMKTVVTAISRVVKKGNPERVPIVIHHSITGRAGAAKAVGWDKASFGRNSKALYNWTRAQLNISPADPEDASKLVIAHGKNNNGAPFQELGVIFDEDRGFYQVDPDFDPQKFREDVGLTGKEKTQKAVITTDEILGLFKVEIPKKDLSSKIQELRKCSKSTAYAAVDRAIAEGKIKRKGEGDYNQIIIKTDHE